MTHILSFTQLAPTPTSDDERTSNARMLAPELFAPRPLVVDGGVHLLRTCRLLHAMQPHVLHQLLSTKHAYPHGFFYRIDITSHNDWLLDVQRDGLPEMVPGMWDYTHTVHLERHDMRLTMWQWKEGVCVRQYQGASLPNIAYKVKWPCDGPIGSPYDACMLGWIVRIFNDDDKEFIDDVTYNEGFFAREERRQWCELARRVW